MTFKLKVNIEFLWIDNLRSFNKSKENENSEENEGGEEVTMTQHQGSNMK